MFTDWQEMQAVLQPTYLMDIQRTCTFHFICDILKVCKKRFTWHFDRDIARLNELAERH